MTLLEKVKEAIKNPDLITDNLMREAMGKRKIFICTETYEPGVGCQECIPEDCEWLQDSPGKRTAKDCDTRTGLAPLFHLTDWNLIMPEIEKRHIGIQPYLDDLGGAVGWLVGGKYSLQLNRACWTAILADMVEKGEVK